MKDDKDMCAAEQARTIARMDEMMKPIPCAFDSTLRDRFGLPRDDDPAATEAETELARLRKELRDVRDRAEAESFALRTMLSQRTAEADELRARLRTTAQILIEEVGADGPMNAEDAAQRAVARLRARIGAGENVRAPGGPR